MDLSVVYSKTAKGLRARASLLGGLPSQLMKVLAHIDGTSKAETILVKHDEISEQKLIVALNLLEREGYIKSLVVSPPSADDWALTENFAPMEVEEVLSAEEAEVKAKVEEEARLQEEMKIREEEEKALEKARIKEKLRAEAKVKAQLEADRITREKEEKRLKAEAEAAAKAQAKVDAAKKAEEESKAKAEQEALLESERKAKMEEKTKADKEARLKAEADAKAKIEQKEHVRREIERISREAEEAEEKKAEAKARAKAEEEVGLQAERKAKEAEEQARIKAEQTKLEAEAKAKAAEQARLQDELKAQEVANQARAKAEAEAKENTRRELARIAREVEEAQRKAEAERRAKEEEEARLEVERKAKAEEKARLKAEAAEKAKAADKEKEKAKERDRNEIARIVREAEEARKKAEAKAKEERLEAKRKAKEVQDAQLKAERKSKVEELPTLAKSEPEETLNVDANLQASLAMQQFTSVAEDESKKSTAEAKEERQEAKRKAKAEQEAERIRVRVEAEEKAKAEEKERARLEMERISREADEVRQKQSAEVHANIAVTATATVKPKSWEEIEAEEERAFAEEEAGNIQPEVKQTEEKHATIEKEAVEDDSVGRVIEKITQEEAERLGREEIKRLAKEEAETLAKTYAKRSARLLSYKKWISTASKAIRPLLIYSPLVIALLVGLLHFVNLSMLVAPIEKLATASLGEAVSIGQVHASLLPQPHLALGDVTIDANLELKKEGLKIESVNAYLAPLDLFDDVKTLSSLEFEGLKITQDNFGQPQQWVNNLGKAQHVKIGQINLKKIVLQIRDLEIGTFEGKVEFAESRELKSYHLTSDTLSAQITPQGSSFEVVLIGNSWPLPMNPKLVFDEFKANGTLTQSQINFSQIDGKIYGGNINAKAAVDWSSEWSAAGNFELSNATLPQLLSAFSSGASIDGKFELKGLFSSRSALAAQLVDAPEITANFELNEGKINNIDLARAVLFKGNQLLAGGATQFNKLTGNLQLINGNYQYGQLVLEADQLSATGSLDIQPNQDVSGKVSANLTAQSRRLYANFKLAGKIGNLQKQ